MASTSSSASFYTTFQSLKTEINQALDTNNIPGASKILVDLKSQFRENVSSLPAYDERSYGTQIRELETRLSSLRPKTSKFSFTKSKSKPKTPSTTPPISSEESAQPLAGASQSDSDTISTSISPGIKGAMRVENLKQAVVRLQPESKSSTVILKNLELCIIDLRPSHPIPTSSSSTIPNEVNENHNLYSRPEITSIHGENLRYCTIIAPINGSVLLHSLTSCILIISCHQFRMHDSSSCSVMIQIPSMPIIEHSTNIGFGPLPRDNEILAPTGESSRHDEVQDFNWIREGKSPNWSLTSEEERDAHIKGIARAILDTDQVLEISEQALDTPD